jgi:two-component system chemotaxis response regulator CheB
VHQLGRPSPFVCPECSGTLFEIEETKEVRYRCRVGHAYSPKTFEASHREELEAALWTAARALEESASLARRMADRARATKRARAAVLYDGLAEERSRQAEQMRSLILTGTLLPVDAEAV